MTVDLYYQDLLKMPIRLSTLDFHKILPLLAKTVEQAEFTTKEKFARESTDVLVDNRHTFIKIELDERNIVLRFLSKSKLERDVKSKYKVSYRQPLPNEELVALTE